MNIERVDPNDEATFREVCAFVIPMAGEVSLVPVDPVAAAKEGWKAIAEGNTWVARIDGKMVGILILFSRGFWQNPAYSYLVNMAFYVAPEHRFALVGRRLLQAAREEATPASKPILIEMINRHRRPHGDGFYAALVGFLPIGHQTILRQGVFLDVDV